MVQSKTKICRWSYRREWVKVNESNWMIENNETEKGNHMILFYEENKNWMCAIQLKMKNEKRNICMNIYVRLCTKIRNLWAHFECGLYLFLFYCLSVYFAHSPALALSLCQHTLWWTTCRRTETQPVNNKR